MSTTPTIPATLPADFTGFDDQKPQVARKAGALNGIPNALPADFDGFDEPSTAPTPPTSPAPRNLRTTPTLSERIGSLIPDTAVPFLAGAKKILVDPFEAMVAKGAEIGGEAGRFPVELATGIQQLPETVRGVTPFAPQPLTTTAETPEGEPLLASAKQAHPIATGIGAAVGETTGGMAADPRMWALGLGKVGGAAVQRLISAGFSLQMLYGAAQSVPGIKDALKRGDTYEATKLLTGAGIQTAMGVAGAAHAVHGGAPETARATTEAPNEISAEGGEAGSSQEASKSQVNASQESAAAATAKAEQTIGAGERLIPEKPETLQAQTDALKAGTNPVVYFPKGTQLIPVPPEDASVTIVKGNKPGAGTYYHDDSITPADIRKAVKNGTFGKLLGFTQSKEEAGASGSPAVLVARDASGTELKAAIVDASDRDALTQQADVLDRQFPGSKIQLETPEQTISARRGPITPEVDMPEHYGHPVTGVDVKITPDELDATANSLFGLENYRDLSPVQQKQVVSAITPTTTGESIGASKAEPAATSEKALLARVSAETPQPQEPVLGGAEKPKGLPRTAPGARPKVEKVETEGYGRQQAQLYVNRIKDPIKREYAQRLMQALLRGGAEPDRGPLDPMSAQAVRSQLTDYFRTAPPTPLEEKYSPEVLQDAREELQSAHNLASSFDQPGRYYSENEGGRKEHTSTGTGFGTWYGVGSSRHIVAEQFPWYADIEQGVGKLGNLIAKGKGAEYNRLLGRVAESIQREKDSAAPVIAEFAPQLSDLSQKIDGSDQELSDTLAQLAASDGRGFRNLRQYVEGKITDGKQALSFFDAIDEAAAEAREASAAETAKPSGGLRTAEGERASEGEPTRAPESSKAATPESAGASEIPESAQGSFRLKPEEIPTALPANFNQFDDAVLPGLRSAVEEQRIRADRVNGERLTEEANRPGADITAKTGEMERNSPLFRESEASSQGEMFQTGKTANRTRSAKVAKITADQTLREAYQPGSVVRSYSGYDKILEFKEGDETQPYPNNTWRVKVIASDKNGNPLPGEGPRWHSTPPEKIDAQAAIERLQGKLNGVKVGDRVEVNAGKLAGKTAEITKLTDNGAYIREHEGSPITFAKNRDFGRAPEESSSAPIPRSGFKTDALKDMLKGSLPETGTLYSGLSPAALKQLLPEGMREWLDTEVKENQRARSLQGKLYDLDSQKSADRIRAMNVLKEAPGTPKDLEAIYHHLEDPDELLTDGQKKILSGYLRPILSESDRINEKLGGAEAENYVHRIPVGKGNLLDRILDGESELSAGRALSKSAGSLKRRTMMALEDEGGNRRVISIKDGKVTTWDDGKPEDLGRIRGLETQGVKSKGDVLERELAPLQSELSKLETERKTLTATKGRQAVSPQRLQNIDDRAAEIREALQDAHRTNEGRLLTDNDLRDKVFVDKNGKQWSIGQATTREIEANTDVRYYKNALASSVLNYLNLRRAERAYDFLDAYKNSADFREAAAKVNGGKVPAGWRTVDLPQFHGYAFEPHTAEVLDWYAKRMQAEGPGVYRQIGDFLRTAIFFNPLIHTPNIGVHWTVEKGVTGFGPQNWGRILRTGGRAIDAVIHQNGDFLDALDQGAPLQSARFGNRETTKLLVQRMGRELEGNPTAAQRVAMALGYANPGRLIRSIYNFSSRVTWLSNDIAMLQATYEHMDRTGDSFKDAISDVSKHIPDYRLPTRIFDSPALAKLMSNPNLTMFGAYHYGALRSYGEMMKGLISENVPLGEQWKSVDRLAMLGLFTFVVYPALDQLAKLMTGDKTAQFRRAGASTFVYNLAQLAQGNKSPTDVLESVATPAVHTKALGELAVNRDLYTGRHIVDWNADPKTIGKQLARFAGQNVAPVNVGTQVAEGKRTIGQQVAGLFGIKTKVPTPAEALARRYAAEAAGSSAPDQDTLERSYLRRQFEDALRQKKMTSADLAKARASGAITADDEKIITQRAAKTPLQNALKNLTAEQALRVWAKASPEEQNEIRPMLQGKLDRLSTVPPSRRQQVGQQIRDAVGSGSAGGFPRTPGTASRLPLTPFAR